MTPATLRKPISPALEKRKAAETFFSKLGEIALVFLGVGILILLVRLGQSLYEGWKVQ